MHKCRRLWRPEEGAESTWLELQAIVSHDVSAGNSGLIGVVRIFSHLFNPWDVFRKWHWSDKQQKVRSPASQANKLSAQSMWL